MQKLATLLSNSNDNFVIFKKTQQMALIGKKNTNWKNESKEVENEIQIKPTIIQKKQSCLILLVHFFHFNLADFLFLKQIFI